MPTASRLFAAIGYFMVAFFASESFKFLMPEGMDLGRFSLVNAGVGLIVGWLVMGRLAGDGYKPAIGHGLRTTATMVFYICLVQGIAEMVRLSVRKRYDGVMEAISGMFEIIIEYGGLALTSVSVIVIVLVGGILAAWFSEWAAQRWS